MNIVVDIKYGADIAQGVDIEGLARYVLEQEQQPECAEVSITLTTNEEVHALNRDFRGIDRPTDVLSFPMGEMDYDRGLYFLGDMVISLERCARQGEEYGGGFVHELQYLTVHSVLHLLGYDHLDEGEEKARMRAREKEIMKRLGYDY